MLDRKRIGLKEFNPTRMPAVKFLLAIQILQSFMIRMQQKLIWKEIVTLMIQSTNNSIKFLIIGCYGIQLGYFEMVYSVKGLPSREEYINHELKLVKGAF